MGFKLTQRRKAHQVEEIDGAKAERQVRTEITGETPMDSACLKPRHQEKGKSGIS